MDMKTGEGRKYFHKLRWDKRIAKTIEPLYEYVLQEWVRAECYDGDKLYYIEEWRDVPGKP